MRKPIFLITLLLLHLLLLINIRFTAWPEMFSYPYLFSKGFKLYTDFVYPYPPLLTLILTSFYKIFGFKIITLKLISWFFILGTDVFLFLIAKKLLKKELLVFLFLLPYILLQSFLDGNMLWFDNALVLPVVTGIYFFVRWIENKKTTDLALVSVFLTAGIFIKQTALVYFAVFLILYFFERKKVVWREINRILLPPLLVGLVFLTWLILNGTIKDFWLWSFYYPLTFWSNFPGYRDFILNFQEKVVTVLILAPLFGAIFIKSKIFKDKAFILALTFLGASMLAVYPRFTYFHLQPVIAMMFIVGVIIFSHLKKYWYAILVYVFAVLAIYPTLNYSLNKNVRFNGDEEHKIIKMVSAHSTKDEKVLLSGLFSSAYVFADRLPPKPWADNFGWYWEVPGYSEYIINKFEEDPPDKIFYKVPEGGNWFDLGVYTPQSLVNYMSEHYYREAEPIGGIELWTRKK